MEILDSHFHIHSMAKRGVDTTLPLSLIGIEVGTEPGDFEKRKPLIPHGIDYSHAAGPWCVQGEDYEGEEKASARVRNDFLLHGGTFLGEIGLDYHWMYGTKEKQIALFESQLDLAEELNLPVIIHSRDADTDMAAIISKRSFPCSGIMHCFSSDVKMMEKALSSNLYISFSGNVTYKSNQMIQDAARAVPAERILYETDSPYLAPVPFRGKPSKPEYTEYTSAFLASLRGADADEFRALCIRNFKTLRALSSGSLQ